MHPPPPAVTSSRNIIHDLIGSGALNFSETVRHSFSSLAARNTSNLRQKEPAKDGQGTELSVVCSHRVGEIREGLVEDQSPKQTSPLLNKLPPEILLAIIRRCRFADIVSLRKTCRTFHLLASPSEMRILLGRDQFRHLLRCHCKICLLHNEDRKKLLQSENRDIGYPLSNKCIDCALAAEDPRVKVGRKVHLANFDSVWVCRWCGRPVAETVATNSEQFHRVCYESYSNTLVVFVLLGWIQWCLGIVAGALAWRYFRWNDIVLGPTITSFLLGWIVLGFIMWRGNRRRTYNWTFGLELIILGLWIPPIYHVAKLVDDDLDAGIRVDSSTWASLVFFGISMLFRLMNVIGNFVLLFHPDLTRRRRPRVVWWRKGLYKLACVVVFFTYPQSIEAKLPPDYL